MIGTISTTFLSSATTVIVSFTSIGDLELLKDLIQQSRRTKIHICLQDLEEALLIAVQTGNSDAIPILVEAGVERLDCALILAMQLENVAAIAYLMLFKSIISQDAYALHTLLDGNEEGTAWYFKQVQSFLKKVQECNVCYLLKVSIRRTNFQATQQLFSTFEVSNLEQKIDLNNLGLPTSLVSFMFSWILDVNVSSNQLKEASPKVFTASQLQQPTSGHSLFAKLNQYCREGLYEELRYALYYEKDVFNQVKAHTQHGNSLLHEAAECDQADIIQLLLQHGASPNVRAKGGVTPLHVAATKGHVSCVKALLEGDADVSLRDNIGHDAFMKAKRSKKKEEIQRLLISKGEQGKASEGVLVVMC